MVDVTHDRNDRRPMVPIVGLVLELAARIPDDFVLAPRDVLDFVVELASQHGSGVCIERAVDVDTRHAELHQLHQHVGSLEAHALRQGLQLNVVVDANHALLRARHRNFGLLRLLARLQTFLAGASLRTTGRPDRRSATDLATARRVLFPLRGMLGNYATTRPFGQRRGARRLGPTPAHDAWRQRIMSEATLLIRLCGGPTWLGCRRRLDREGLLGRHGCGRDRCRRDGLSGHGRCS